MKSTLLACMALLLPINAHARVPSRTKAARGMKARAREH
jgi:hypothetical protein